MYAEYLDASAGLVFLYKLHQYLGRLRSGALDIT